MNSICKRFRKKPRTVADDPTFVALVRLARSDPTVGTRLCAILRMDRFHRKSLLNTLLAQMQLRQAPASFVGAVSKLLDDAVADQVLRLIQRER